MTKPDMTDQELAALLSLATRPALAAGAESRLLRRLKDETAATAPDVVVPLRRSTATHSRLGWLAGLPLAASLAFGIYLGIAGLGGDLLPTTAELSAAESEYDAPTGIEEAEDLVEEEPT